MEDDQKIQLEDTKKIQNGRQLKDDQNILKMEEDKTIKMKDNQKNLISRNSKCNNNND